MSQERTPELLSAAVRRMISRPIATLVPPWSWKAAACTAVLRAGAFFVTNLSAGRGRAAKAMLVEAFFGVFAGGLIGAMSQHLRRARPVWATGMLLCLVLPGAMTVAQVGVHHLAGTAHESSGFLATFVLAALAAAYTWFAMRHGVLLGGVEETTVRHDLHRLPNITLGFLLAGPRLVQRWQKAPGPYEGKPG